MLPVNFELSTPPKMGGGNIEYGSRDAKTLDLPHVSSPFASEVLVAGSNETPIDLAEMVPDEKRLSVTVGMEEEEAGERVPTVRPTGPILTGRKLFNKYSQRRLVNEAYSPEDAIDTVESSGLEDNASTLILKTTKGEDRRWKRRQSIAS